MAELFLRALPSPLINLINISFELRSCRIRTWGLSLRFKDVRIPTSPCPEFRPRLEFRPVVPGITSSLRRTASRCVSFVCVLKSCVFIICWQMFNSIRFVNQRIRPRISVLCQQRFRPEWQFSTVRNRFTQIRLVALAFAQA